MPKYFSHYDQSFCYAAIGPVAFSSWRGLLTSEHIDLTETLWTQIAETHPEGFCVLTVVKPTAPAPAGAARRRVEKIYTEYGDHLRAVATVIPGSGMRATTGRLLMGTLSVLLKPTYPTRITSNVADAARWLDEKLPLEVAPLIERVRRIHSEYADIIDPNGSSAGEGEAA